MFVDKFKVFCNGEPYGCIIVGFSSALRRKQALENKGYIVTLEQVEEPEPKMSEILSLPRKSITLN